MDRRMKDAVLATLGLMFVWPLFRANYYGEIVLSGVTSAVDGLHLFWLLLLAQALICIVALFWKSLARRIFLDTRPWVPIVMGIVTSAGALMVVSANGFELFDMVMLHLGALAMTIGQLGIIGLWTKCMASFPRLVVLRILIASFALGFLLSFLVNLLSESVVPFVKSVYMLLSMAAYTFIPNLPPANLEKESLFDCKRLTTVLISLVILILAGTLMRGYVLAQTSYDINPQSQMRFYLAGLTCAVIAFALTFAAKGLWTYINALWTVLMVAFALALVVLFVVPSSIYAGIEITVVVVREFLNLLLGVFVVFLFQRRDVSRAKLMGHFMLLQLLCALIAYCVVPTLQQTLQVELSMVAAVGLVLILADNAWFYIRYTFKPRPSEIIEVPVPGSEESAEDLHKKACAAVGVRYGLTDRELEVLELLSSGLTRKAIAQELYVSAPTVASHTQGIYSKTGCHKKDEIIQLVKSYGEHSA